jgi:hypothetical protein
MSVSTYQTITVGIERDMRERKVKTKNVYVTNGTPPLVFSSEGWGRRYWNIPTGNITRGLTSAFAVGSGIKLPL